MKFLERIRKFIGRSKEPVVKDKWLVRVTNDMMKRNAKFDITEDYYLRYHCKECGLFADADSEDEGFGSCECGSTDIWVTRGHRWIEQNSYKAFWDNVKTTDDIMVPLVKRKWLVGQERPMARELMQLARWVDKLKKKQEAQKRGDLEDMTFLKENPGPYLLRISEPGVGKCVASSTPVILGNLDVGYPVWIWERALEKGKKAETTLEGEVIKDPGIELWQSSETGLVKAKVSALYRQRYSGEMIKIRTSSGRYILCSPEHHMLMETGWEKASNVVCGQNIVVPSPVAESEGTIKTNPEMAELLAYILAEGHVVRGYPVTITNEDPSIRVRIEYLLDKYVWNWSQNKRRTAYLLPPSAIDHIQNYFQVHTQWSLYGKSATKQLPPRIMCADLDTVRAFIGAYIASDGSRADNAITIATISQSLADHLSFLFLRLGMFATVRRKDSVLSYGDRRRYTSYELRVWSGDNAKVMKLPFTAGKTDMLRVYNERRDNRILDKVKLVTRETYKGDYIYDFEMEGEPHYIAGHNGGMIVHNSLASKIIEQTAGVFYRENGIEFTDVMTIENAMDKQKPLVRQVPCHSIQGGGCLAPRISRQAERGAYAEQKEKQQLIFIFLMIAIGLGGALLGTGLFVMGLYVMAYGIVTAWMEYMGAFLFFFVAGVPLMVFPLFILVIAGSSIFGVNKADTANVPHPIVTHGNNPKFVHPALNPNVASLLGSIEWNAYGNTPNLTGPLHRRVVAGIVHKANDAIIDVDEVRTWNAHTATEMLQVMEDGQSVIQSRGGQGMGNVESSAILAISTNDPVPADFFLVCNGNLDLIYRPDSIFKQVPAFYDRFGYGDRVYWETHMRATPENEIKVAQVITDEIYRLRLHPMEKDGMRRIIEYMRSRADNNQLLKIMFRYVINVILQAHNLTLVEGRDLITLADVERAINEFSTTLMEQALTEQLDNKSIFELTRTTGTEYGLVNGLAVISYQGTEGRSAGKAFPVAAVVEPVKDPKYGEFVVTGEMKDQSSWVQDSIKTVRTVIRKLYGKDLSKDYYTHVSFARQKDVEGPSAGVAMTLAVMSLLGDPRIPEADRKPVPIRLDVGVTGTIELVPDPSNPMNVRVGAIGGVPEKVQGAAKAGCKFVIVPMENYLYTLTQEQYPCKIFGADSILGYYDLIRADGKGTLEPLLTTKVSDLDVAVWASKQAERKKRETT